MYKLYKKSLLGFTLLCFAVYSAGSSISEAVSRALNMGSAVPAAFMLAAAMLLFRFLKRNGLAAQYGLCRSSADAKLFLWYIPLIVLTSSNLWGGAALSFSPTEAFFLIIKMLSVGFIEELFFRGFLFSALCRRGVKFAVLVSSLSFGLIHIVNLFNGSGMGAAENLMQIAGASAAGFLYVTIFCRGGSLLPCVLSHGIYNCLGLFSAAPASGRGIYISLIEWALSIGYAFYILKAVPAAGENSEYGVRQ